MARNGISTDRMLVCFVSFVLVAPLFYSGMIVSPVLAQSAVRAWKDDSSFGLENDRLLVTGSKVAYVYNWGWNSLTFKDTHTVWKLPWNELSAGATIGLGVNAYNSSSFTIDAATESNRAYITYAVTKGNLKWDQTYAIFAGEPYIYEKIRVTNIGSIPTEFDPQVQYISYIAGDVANDYYFAPGFGQGQFTGDSKDRTYSPAAEGWIAMWDTSKNEGVGIATPNKTVQYRTYDWFGICECGEGASIDLNHLSMEPHTSSQEYEAYLYFFTGSRSADVENFYKSIVVLPVVPTNFPKNIMALLSGTEGVIHIGEERNLRVDVINLENKTVLYRVKAVSDAVDFIGADEQYVRVEPLSSYPITFVFRPRESGEKNIVVIIYQDATIISQSPFMISVAANPSFWEVQPPWYVYVFISGSVGAVIGYFIKEVLDRIGRKPPRI